MAAIVDEIPLCEKFEIFGLLGPFSRSLSDKVRTCVLRTVRTPPQKVSESTQTQRFYWLLLKWGERALFSTLIGGASFGSIEFVIDFWN